VRAMSSPKDGSSLLSPGAVGEPSSRSLRLVVALVVGVLALVGAGIAWGVSSSGGSGVRNATKPTRVVLTAAEVHAIAASSSTAMASTGTAQVTDTTTENGVAQTSDTIAVTFDGANIDEKITVNPEPPGSAKIFTTDDRLVDGQFYIYTFGPNDVTEWLHDTGSGSDVSMQFPDPRTLYGEFNPRADFAVLGPTTSNGVTLTHLEALDPAAISTSALASLMTGTFSSFEIWTDENDVVQQMAFTSSQTENACAFDLMRPQPELKGGGASTRSRGPTGSLPGRRRQRARRPRRLASPLTAVHRRRSRA
ncbi:MAG TPA: hypothetical protein VED84_03490, partial [Acidimicrobiales bacterium]|nr:hypothetical protein [Acidimicrobiales bacterium]